MFVTTPIVPSRGTRGITRPEDPNGEGACQQANGEYGQALNQSLETPVKSEPGTYFRDVPDPDGVDKPQETSDRGTLLGMLGAHPNGAAAYGGAETTGRHVNLVVEDGK